MADKKGKNRADTQLMNRTLVFTLIRDNMDISRSVLADISGLKPATISYIVQDFIAAGLVEEVGSMRSASGRHPIALRLSGKRAAFRIFDVREDAVDLMQVGFDASVLHVAREECDGSDAGAIAQCIASLSNMQEEEASAAGIVANGQMLRALDEFARKSGHDDARVYFEKQLEMSVALSSAVHASALAAWNERSKTLKQGAFRPVVYIDCGEELAHAAACADEEFLGLDSLLGHLCINYNGPVCTCGARGCLGLYATTRAIRSDIDQKRTYHAKNKLDGDSPIHGIARLFKAADPLAVSAVGAAAGYLAIGVESLIKLLDPSAVILGGDVVEFGGEYMAILLRVLESRIGSSGLERVQISLETVDRDCPTRILGMHAMLSSRFIAHMLHEQAEL